VERRRLDLGKVLPEAGLAGYCATSEGEDLRLRRNYGRGLLTVVSDGRDEDGGQEQGGSDDGASEPTGGGCGHG
jgi:hypothetical protein